MASVPARYAVGIDLGSTNTVVAYALVDSADGARVFDVPQLVSAREVEARSLLPSMLYAPLDGELVEDPFGDAPWIVGEHARRRGAEVSGRLVASSKSWLVHAGVDRAAAILPWGAEGGPKLSPVDAAARLLAHVRSAWDARHPDSPLAEQETVLTVPASFDEVARELTVEAARRAGLSPKLLEEPQAAFYDWMARAGSDGLRRLTAATGGAVVLVVDVGGGTTDLSLVRVAGADSVTRVAVGPHLLLGGDNMDLALAHACEPRLANEGSRLDVARFAQLVSACRGAKEMLLGASPPEDAPVTLLGRGADLVGASRTSRVSRDEVERLVLDGFFPVVSPEARPNGPRGALVAFGLPYERDVAITRHIATFLARSRRIAGDGSDQHPNVLLLNGGLFRSERIALRVVDTISGWRGEPIHRLRGTDPDLAVARGAVAYARARLGRGVRIGGGVARGYFVSVATPEAPRRAVCVVPRGSEEGQSHAAEGRVFALAVGRPARFDLLASSDVDARPGEVVEVDDERFARFPPLAITIDAGERDLRVRVEGELTPIGTLDLACVDVDDASARPRRFRLAFQLREPSDRDESPAGSTPVASPPRDKPSQISRRLERAVDAVERAFGRPRADANGREAKDLLRELERLLGERAQWTIETNRGLFDVLAQNARARRRSADHERVFWLLAGWCIRPGFGDALDPRRTSALHALFDDRLSFPAESRGWQQFWIAWRRAAGGLDEAMQTKIRDFADGHLAPLDAIAKRPKKAALSLDDALDMAASLERVPASRRVELGGWVLERTWTDRDPRLWSAVGRIGARVPAYASVHHVAPPQAAERWLDHLLREKWSAVPTAGQAAVRLSRRTGDRARDVAESVRREVEQRLVAAGASEAWLRSVREVVPVEESERAALFGDALPPGLRLVD